MIASYYRYEMSPSKRVDIKPSKSIFEQKPLWKDSKNLYEDEN